jgi:hypothetical protein
MTYDIPTAINARDQPLVTQLCEQTRAYIAARDPSLTTVISQNCLQIYALTGTPMNYLAPVFSDVI